MTFGIRFRSGAVESTFLYRSSMFLNLETLSFSHRKPSKVMDRSLVSCDAKNRVNHIKSKMNPASFCVVGTDDRATKSLC